jgi:MOSC domain-containing protein YiiM
LCRPCKPLQEKLGKDNIIKEFLRRGGLRCEILNSGNIKIGDNIKTI